MRDTDLDTARPASPTGCSDGAARRFHISIANRRALPTAVRVVTVNESDLRGMPVATYAASVLCATGEYVHDVFEETVRRSVSTGSFAVVVFRQANDARSLASMLDDDVDASCLYSHAGAMPLAVEESIEDGAVVASEASITLSGLAGGLLAALRSQMLEHRERHGFADAEYQAALAEMLRVQHELSLQSAREAEYVRRHGMRCPHCQSADIKATGDVQLDGCAGRQEIVCRSCNHSWDDHYSLTGFSSLSDAAGNPVSLFDS